MRRESRAGKLLGHLPEPCCDVAAIRVGNAGFRVFATSRRAVAERTDGVTMLTCDVTDDVSVAKLVEEVLAEAGRIDLLVNNAGICPLGGAEEFSTDQAPGEALCGGEEGAPVSCAVSSPNPHSTKACGSRTRWRSSVHIDKD